MQQGVQMDTTCNIQQCWDLLANTVASVCKVLKTKFYLLIYLFIIIYLCIYAFIKTDLFIHNDTFKCVEHVSMFQTSDLQPHKV